MGIRYSVIKAPDNKDNDWVNLPAELLVKILLYLSIYDRIRMRYVCRRFRDIGEMPLLWKNFVWTYRSHHLRMVSNLLKVYGEHVRQIYFPAHVTKKVMLEMARCCAKVTHLSLPEDTQLTLIQLEEVIRTTTYLQQLEVFTQGDFVTSQYSNFIEGLLKITAASVKELKLRTHFFELDRAIENIKERANQGHPLPSVISICCTTAIFKIPELFKCWPVSSYSKLPPCKIVFYDTEKLAMNLYPVVPVRIFMFGTETPCPLVRLDNHGIVGLEFDMFHLNEYDHYGTIRHAIMPAHDLRQVHIEDEYFKQASPLYSVSYVDFSSLNVRSYHLEQLAVACPNLQRLGIQGNSNCLEDLRGLRAIVHTCQNLEILSLNKISVSRVESHLLLWELLSSVKRLKYLNVDLCMVKLSDSDDANNKQKLIAMFKQCLRLQAMKIFCVIDCTECNNNADFLFSHYPSLVYCVMLDFCYSGIAYAMSNCHWLKHLYECSDRLREVKLHPSNCNRHLQYVGISMKRLNMSDKLVRVLSAHGELESVSLVVKSITFNGICTLIKNSPNLVTLYLSFRIPLFGEAANISRQHGSAGRVKIDYVDRVRNQFSKKHHKLFQFGGEMTIVCRID